MKKQWKVMLSMILLTAALFCSVTVLAAEGEVVGQIYSTDILAYVNGQPIDAYNIGGRTMVIAEDLDHYGYSHWYDDATRTLNLKSYFTNAHYDIAEIPRGKTGQIIGEIYATDIQVFYNEIPITGYNIGGRTAICIEDMGEVAGSPYEVHGFSKYLAYYVWNGESRAISLHNYISNEHEIMGFDVSRVIYTFADNVIYALPDDGEVYASMEPSINGVPDGPMEEMYTYYYTEEFGDRRYQIEPLYLDTNGMRTGIGYCLAIKDEREDFVFDRVYPHIEDPARVKELAKTVKTPVKTYDEAMMYLEETYTILEEIEDGDYTIVKVADAEENKIIFAIKNSGGCLRLGEYSNHYTYVDIVYNEQEGCYCVEISPFAGPHGATTMSSRIRYEHLQFD